MKLFWAASVLLALGACSLGAGEAEEAVRGTMKDPQAAQFEGVNRCSNDDAVWSGSVNGKNGFGAYTGFKPFFYAGGVVAYAGDSEYSGLLQRCYGKQVGSSEAVSQVTAEPLSEREVAEIKAASSVPAPRQEGEEDSEHPNLADVDAEEAEQSQPLPSRQCWADYCPCDSSDPDYGYLDVTLCRKIKQGMHVSDGEFSIGAGSRDARKSLREFREQNGGEF